MADCNWTGEYHPNCGINTGVAYYSDAPFYTGCCPRSIDGTDTTEEEFNQAIIDRNALLVLISTSVPSQVYSWRGEIVYWENGTAEPADPPILGADETMHLAGGPSPASYAIRGGDMIHQSEEQVLDWFKSTMNCEANNNTSTYNMNRVTHTNPSYKYYDYHPQAVVDLIVYGYCNTIECPPNTHLKDGYCVPDPDFCRECWYLIPGTIDCSGGLLEFTIGYYNNGADACTDFVISNRSLQISYAGSTVPLGGPTEIMGSTFNPTKFYVNVPKTICSTDEIHVELINPSSVNLSPLPGCPSPAINITNECLCPEGGGGGGNPEGGYPAQPYPPGIYLPEPGIPENADCCTFFNDNYTEWEYTNCIDFFSDYPAKY